MPEANILRLSILLIPSSVARFQLRRERPPRAADKPANFRHGEHAMATLQQLRELALSLPETVEKSHFGQPDFRVGNKIFAGLKPKEGRGWLKLSAARQAALVSLHPEAYVAAEGAWGRSGWTYVVLSEIAVRDLRSLLEEAWALIAPRESKSVASSRATAPARRRSARKKTPKR